MRNAKSLRELRDGLKTCITCGELIHSLNEARQAGHIDYDTPVTFKLTSTQSIPIFDIITFIGHIESDSLSDDREMCFVTLESFPEARFQLAPHNEKED